MCQTLLFDCQLVYLPPLLINLQIRLHYERDKKPERFDNASYIYNYGVCRLALLGGRR